MKSHALIVGGIIALIYLISGSSGIEVSIASDVGSISESFSPALEDTICANAVLSSDALQNRVSGEGDFNEEHWIKNDFNDTAGVGVDIKNAKKYDYSYSLEKGEGGSLSARENLDVDDALGITAFAEARDSKGNKARSEVSIEHGSLKGYSNQALVSPGAFLSSSQGFSKAEGDMVIAESRGLSISPYNTTSGTSTIVKFGTITNHSSQATIQKPTKKISVEQFNHIEIDPSKGSFEGSSYLRSNGREEKLTRTSNYGTKYDLKLISSSQPRWWTRYDYTTKGTLAYYVDKSNPNANLIQGAIKASWNGDSIKIAPGTYYENLIIGKSLKINGAGADKTIIDGKGDGHVAHIKEGVKVRLEDLGLTNGSARLGGGVYNKGDLVLKDCNVFSNEATYGGGISNSGNLTLGNCKIFKNKASYGGAIYSDHGYVYLNGGDISNNTALTKGGGIYNDWTFTRGIYGDKSIVHDNRNGDIVHNYWNGWTIGFWAAVIAAIIVTCIVMIYIWPEVVLGLLSAYGMNCLARFIYFITGGFVPR